MERNTITRQIIFVCVATVAYYTALDQIRPLLPSATIPNWWLAFWPSKHIGFVSWLSAMDVTSAFASAIVVAIISLVILKQMRARLGFIVGALCAIFVAVQSAMEYNSFASASAIVVLVVQFLALSFAIPLTIKAIEKCTLTNSSLRRV